MAAVRRYFCKVVGAFPLGCFVDKNVLPFQPGTQIALFSVRKPPGFTPGDRYMAKLANHQQLRGPSIVSCGNELLFQKSDL